MPFTAAEANKPVAKAPHIPAIPWHANTSRVSSIFVLVARQLATKLDKIPATSPIIIEGITPTKPDAGVIATNPQMTPMEKPTAEGFPFLIQSTPIQLRPAAAAAKFVTTKAFAASPLAAKALPPLNPNHPNHSKAAPKITNGTLFGFISPMVLRLLPINTAAAKADIPAAIWTTVPPAKSIAPNLANHPSAFQTQCATGE